MKTARKDRALKKVQIAIDKMVDLYAMCPASVAYSIDEVLEKLREVERKIENL